MIRPSITQAIIDNSVEVITENTLDGVGIPYYNESEPMRSVIICDPSCIIEEEDDIERARR